MNKVIKPSFVVLLTMFFGLVSIAQVAEAKRFGGGKSFGFSKTVAPKSFKKAPTAAPKAAPTSTKAGAAGAKPRSGMMGILGGLAAGGLLAALFMGGGFEGIQIMDILLFALVGFVLFKLFRHFASRQNQASPQHAYEAPPQQSRQSTPEPEEAQVHQRESASEYNPNSGESIFGSSLGDTVSDQAVHLSETPEWFNAEEFVEGAKGHFVTLQKAWDNADLSEVKSYCSPELFEAIKSEMEGTQAGENQTVVDTLDAEVADMAIDGEYFIVSIRFTGFIQEDTTEGAHAFNEIWHIRRLANDEGTWQVSGIQQTTST